MRTPLLCAALAAALSGPTLAATPTAEPAQPSPAAAQPASGAASAAGRDPTDDTASMARMQEAAQRFREAIRAMAQQPAGEQRRQAIKAANKALFETQSAMLELPPEIWTGPGTPAHPNDPKAMERLQQAAQQLREAVQAMAQRPAGAQRDDAIETANQALYDAREAMILLPLHANSPGALKSASSASSATGTSKGASSVAGPTATSKGASPGAAPAERSAAADQLREASDKLRSALQAMQQPSGKSDGQAAQLAKAALVVTQQAASKLEASR